MTGDEIQINVSSDSPNLIEEDVPVPKGEHKLTIWAVNIHNITETKEYTAIGSLKPKIEVYAQDENLMITVVSEDAIKQVGYKLNGRLTEFTEIPDVVKHELTIKQPMDLGENRLEIEAINIYNIVETFEGTINYNP